MLYHFINFYNFLKLFPKNENFSLFLYIYPPPKKNFHLFLENFILGGKIHFSGGEEGGGEGVLISEEI